MVSQWQVGDLLAIGENKVQICTPVIRTGVTNWMFVPPDSYVGIWRWGVWGEGSEVEMRS